MTDDVFLEIAFSAMMFADVLAMLMTEVVIGYSEHVHLDSRGDERDGWSHMLWKVASRAIALSGTRIPARISIVGILLNWIEVV